MYCLDNFQKFSIMCTVQLEFFWWIAMRTVSIKCTVWNICTIFTSILLEVTMERWKSTCKCYNLAPPCKIKYNVIMFTYLPVTTAKYGYFKFRIKIQQLVLFNQISSTRTFKCTVSIKCTVSTFFKRFLLSVLYK